MPFTVNARIRTLTQRIHTPDEVSILRLDRNESPFPPSPLAIAAARVALDSVNRYGEPGSSVLREALSVYTGIDKAAIFVGNGSDEIIELLSRIMLESGDEVLLPEPTFAYYYIATIASGGIVRGVPRQPGFRLDPESVLTAVNERTKIIYLANPNNPTGVLDSRASLIKILDARPPALVVVDECYFEFCGITVVDLVSKYENLLVLRSFSKTFSLAGLRAGYAIARSELCGFLSRSAQAFSINRIAQAAAIAALNDVEYMRGNIRILCRERDQIGCALTRLGFTVWPSAANFVLVNTRHAGKTAEELSKALKSSGFAIADLSHAPGLGEYFARISVGLPTQNEALLEAIEQILGEVAPSK